MSEIILEVTNLVKRYGNYTAVNHISFSVPRGKIIGFLGPNGAGKTTTIQMLLGITVADAGSIQYFGKDFLKYREASLQRINFTSAFNYLIGRMTIWENLKVYAHLYHVKKPEQKIQELSDYFKSDDIMHMNFMDLSAGQKTRVNLMKALLNDPELILMDEPTASLDPDVADRVLTFIEDTKKSKNLTLLYTSHNMDEVTRICDEVIILDHGKIVAHDTPLALTKRIGHAKLILTFEGDKHAIAQYMVEHNHSFSFHHDYMIEVEVEEKDIPKVIYAMAKLGVWVTDIEVKKPDLEDVFLQIARSNNHVA